MRNWMIGLLAIAGSAFAVVPAMAQSEFGSQYPDWVWDEYDTGLYYTPPTLGMEIVPAPPSVAVAPEPAEDEAEPDIAYFSPPADADTTAAVPAPEAPPVGPGQCGTYHFWSEAMARCVDARAR